MYKEISGIYAISNTKNDKKYIGSSKIIRTDWGKFKPSRCRFYMHRFHLRKNNHSNDHLQNAWNKYGEESFEFEVLMKCSEDQLLFAEQYWMDKYNVVEDGYNISPKADRTEFSDETLEKMSEAQKNRDHNLTHSEETKQLLSKKAKERWENLSKEEREELTKKKIENREIPTGEDHPLHGTNISKERKEKISEAVSGKNHPNYGQSLDKETKEKISESVKGFTHTEETKRKMSESSKGFTHTEESKRKISENQPDVSGEDHHWWNRGHSEESIEKMKEKHKGSKNAMSKLDEESVREIKRKLKHTNKTCKEISKEYPVSDSTIYNINEGYSWDHVKIEDDE